MATFEQRREALCRAAELVRHGPLPYRSAKTVTVQKRRKAAR